MKPPATIVALFAFSYCLAGSGSTVDRLSDILVNTFRYNARTPNIIDVRELKTGCSHRDCVRSVDAPEFIAVRDVHYLQDSDLLMVVSHNGITRAYPHKILNLREVVNDRFGDTPVLVSYSPLCSSGAAFIAQVNGLPVEFGVSGMVHNNGVVMYDRRYNNLWGQITGEAVVGQNAGDRLRRVPARTVSWAGLKTHHTDVHVLKPSATDEVRLDQPSFGNYDTSKRLYYPVSAKDGRTHPKEPVYGIELNGYALAISEKYLQKRYLQKKPEITRAVGGHVIVVRRREDGSVTATDKDNGAEIPVVRLFWFAWYTFYTNTELVI